MADPSRFSDPFFSVNLPSLSEGVAVAKATGSVGTVHPVLSFKALDASSGGAEVDSNEPLGTIPAGIDFKIPGLGLIAVQSAAREKLEFLVYAGNQVTLRLNIGRKDVSLYKWDKNSGSEVKMSPTFPKNMKSACLNCKTEDETVYWISVDRSNSRFRCGQHLMNASMTYVEATFEDNVEGRWMNELTSTEVVADNKPLSSDKIRYFPSPITVVLPPLVISENEISLEQLENYSAMTYVNLPKGCQNLYHNIAGQKITLESASFPQLAEAIDQSCKDKKKVCGKILEEKKTKFDRPTESYLRITIGDNLANSPGIPYVMEIWPPGHSSPIHDHGKASAVIKVLYGSIDCTWYDGLYTDRTPQVIGKPTRLSKGQITWLGDKQYQIHKLQNNCKTVCITLQCYQFEEDDTVHYEYFDYITDKNKRRTFVPDSDYAYGKFLEAMQREWAKKAEGPGVSSDESSGESGNIE